MLIERRNPLYRCFSGARNPRRPRDFTGASAKSPSSGIPAIIRTMRSSSSRTSVRFLLPRAGSTGVGLGVRTIPIVKNGFVRRSTTAWHRLRSRLASLNGCYYNAYPYTLKRSRQPRLVLGSCGAQWNFLGTHWASSATGLSIVYTLRHYYGLPQCLRASVPCAMDRTTCGRARHLFWRPHHFSETPRSHFASAGPTRAWRSFVLTVTP